MTLKIKKFCRYSITIFFLASMATCVSCALFGGGSEIQRSKEYHVQAPSTWKSTDTNGESDQAYKLPSGNVATLTSSCSSRPHPSLDVLTRQLLMGARNINFAKKEKVKVAGEEGLHSSVKATLDGNPFLLELFVLPNHGCVFDFSLVSPKLISDKDSEEFLAFVKSFTYGTN